MTRNTLRVGGGRGVVLAWFGRLQTERNPFPRNDLGFPTSVPPKFTILVMILAGLFSGPGRCRMHIVISEHSDMFPPKKPGAGFPTPGL